jgi:hypothetical protein
MRNMFEGMKGGREWSEEIVLLQDPIKFFKKCKIPTQNIRIWWELAILGWILNTNFTSLNEYLEKSISCSINNQ